MREGVDQGAVRAWLSEGVSSGQGRVRRIIMSWRKYQQCSNQNFRPVTTERKNKTKPALSAKSERKSSG